ncbi:hypothetical protein [Sphingobium herbicidovorans]|nr:hypothetical protein [Sphingobium herbicidovorans]
MFHQHSHGRFDKALLDVAAFLAAGAAWASCWRAIGHQQAHGKKMRP